MGKECDLTGKRVQSGNNVSHSRRRTKRTFAINLHRFSLFSAKLNRKLPLRISIRALRILEKKGGIDDFLLGAPNHKLPAKALHLKKQLLKCQK